MTKEEIINYIMQSPENTNPNVLRGLLENNGGSSLSTRFDVTFTQNKDETWSTDKTYEEIDAAYEEGKVIIF